MLASTYLLKPKDVEKVKENGKLIQGQNFGVVIWRRQEKGNSRFAFVISSKISKLAVHRNRIKRALNEAVRMNLSKVPERYDIVFLVKKSIVSKTTEEIMNETRVFLDNLTDKL